jgi:hypothetical protein
MERGVVAGKLLRIKLKVVWETNIKTYLQVCLLVSFNKPYHMKKILFIISFLLIAFVSKAQVKSSDKQAIEILKIFYTAHCRIWAIKPPPPPKIFNNKLDSLHAHYCTKKLTKEAKEWLNDGHDLFTDDWGIDIESLKSMTIIKDSVKSTYVVSYIVTFYPQSPTKPVKEHVVLHVTLTKENGEFKITSIKDSTTRRI